MARRGRNWIETYLQYTKDHESPEAYHFWSGIVTISAAVRRNVWLDLGFYKLFPNLYLVLVAESARLRKSTALEIAEPLLKDIKDVCVIHEKITFEKLVERLSRTVGGKPESTGYIFAPEFTVFLGGGDENTRKLISFLVSIHTGKDRWEYDTIGRGLRTIENVLLTIAGASTPEWLQKIPHDAVGGGLMGRIIWVGARERRLSMAWTDEVKPAEELRKILMQGLVEISKIKGPFSVEERARETFRDWYENIKEPSDPRVASFVERMHDQARRVAMLLSLSEGNSLKICNGHIKKAIDLVENVARFMPRVLEFVGSSEHSRDADRIISQIRKAGGEMMHGQLLALNSWKLSAEDFKKVMQTLVERGEVIASPSGRGNLYVLKDRKKK